MESQSLAAAGSRIYRLRGASARGARWADLRSQAGSRPGRVGPEQGRLGEPQILVSLHSKAGGPTGAAAAATAGEGDISERYWWDNSVMGVERQAARRTTCWSRRAACALRAMAKRKGAGYRPLKVAVVTWMQAEVGRQGFEIRFKVGISALRPVMGGGRTPSATCAARLP